MGRDDALWLSRRAGGVDDVRRVAGDRARQPGLFQHRRRADLDDLNTLHGEGRLKSGRRDNDPQSAVALHEFQALKRVGKVQRHIGPPGHENAQHGDGDIEIAVCRHADPISGSYAFGDQSAGQTLRPGLKLRIGDGVRRASVSPSDLKRYGVRRAFDAPMKGGGDRRDPGGRSGPALPEGALRGDIDIHVSLGPEPLSPPTSRATRSKAGREFSCSGASFNGCATAIGPA